MDEKTRYKLLSEIADLMQFSSLRHMDAVNFVADLLLLHYLEYECKMNTQIQVPAKTLFSNIIESQADMMKKIQSAMEMIEYENKIIIFIPIHVKDLHYNINSLTQLIANIDVKLIDLEKVIELILTATAIKPWNNTKHIQDLLNTYKLLCSSRT